jgi:predicted nucleotidyltransferase
MESRKELVKQLIDHHSADKSVLGVIQVGSTAKGYDDKHSDIDLEFVVTRTRYDSLTRMSQKFIHTKRYDLIFTTLDKLQKTEYSEVDEDHWFYKDCSVLLDRTGKLKRILKKITRYNMDSRMSRLKRHYLGYWENTLGSMSCFKHKNNPGARVYVAFAIHELLRLLFNLNCRWTPKIQWVFKEIHLLQKKPASLESRIVSILEEPDPDKLSKLWDDTAFLLREEGYTWVDHPEEIM